MTGRDAISYNGKADTMSSTSSALTRAARALQTLRPDFTLTNAKTFASALLDAPDGVFGESPLKWVPRSGEPMLAKQRTANPVNLDRLLPAIESFDEARRGYESSRYLSSLPWQGSSCLEKLCLDEVDQVYGWAESLRSLVTTQAARGWAIVICSMDPELRNFGDIPNVMINVRAGRLSDPDSAFGFCDKLITSLVSARLASAYNDYGDWLPVLYIRDPGAFVSRLRTYTGPPLGEKYRIHVVHVSGKGQDSVFIQDRSLPSNSLCPVFSDSNVHKGWVTATLEGVPISNDLGATSFTHDLIATGEAILDNLLPVKDEEQLKRIKHQFKEQETLLRNLLIDTPKLESIESNKDRP